MKKKINFFINILLNNIIIFKYIIILLLSLHFSGNLYAQGNNLIKNSSFTNGFQNWVSTGNWYNGTFTSYYTAPNYAWFATSSGQQGNNLSGTLSQNITIPSCGSNGSFFFRFYYRISSDETTTTNAYDKLTAQALTSSGAIISQITLSNLNKSGVYAQSQNITIPGSYSGQSVTIKFIGTTDASLGSTFRIDDVEVIPTMSPDLNIIAASVSPTSVSVGGTVTAHFSENNDGSGYAGPNVVSLHISKDKIFDPQGVDLYLDEYRIPNGVCGLSNTSSLSKLLSIPSVNPYTSYVYTPGQYYIVISADGVDSDYESNNNNNDVFVPITITCPLTNITPLQILPGSPNPSTPQNIATLTPTLQWNSVAGANYYQAFIKDNNSNSIVYSSPCTNALSISVPSGVLQTNGSYRWNYIGELTCDNSCTTNYPGGFYFTTNPCSPVTSVTINPLSQSICVGGTAYNSVVPNGTPPFTYQWKKGTTTLTDGTKYHGATSSILSIGNITSNDAGTYSCTVTGCNSSSITSSNQLNVTTNGTAPNVSFSASSNDINVGQSVIFLPLNSCTGCTYLWSFSGGTPTYSTQQSQIVTYNTAGTYHVSLTETNSCGLSSTNSIAGFITVNANSSHNSNPVTPPNTIVNKDGYHIAFAGDPVKIPTLDYGYNNAVLSMNTVAGPMDFKVYYNSNTSSYNSNLGTGWSHNFDFKVQNEGDTIWRMFYGEGYNVPFIKLHNDGSKSFPLYAGIFETLVKDTIANTYALTFKNGTVYYFNSLGKLNYIQDRYNNITNFGYNSNGDLIKITAPGGRYWTLINTNGRITKITDLANRTVQFNYTGTDITGIDDPEQNETNFEYDAAHLMTRIINPERNILLENVYTNGKVTTQYDGNHIPTIFRANYPSNNYTTVSFSDGSSKVYQSDDFYRIIDEQDEEGYHNKYGYHADNTDSLFIDKNGNQTTFDKDTIGNITAIHRPLGVNESFEYGKFSLLTKQTDGEGYTTIHNRDGLGNEIETILPDSSHITRQFDNTTGQLKSETNQIYSTSYSYNTQGDINHITTPTGGIDIVTNPIGWDTLTTNQIGQKTIKGYNQRGLITRYTDIDNKSIYNGYDRNSNKTSVTDKMGYTTQFKFDQKDRQFATINYNGDTIDRKYYDDRDFIFATKGPNNVVTKYDNDRTGLPKKITNPLGGTITISRYNNGNVKTSTDDLHGITTTNIWDPLNRNTSVTVGNLNTSKIYLKNSWVSSITNTRTLPTKFLYNPLGKVNDIEDPNHVHTKISYNALGNPTVVTDPNSNSTQTIYDGSNRPYKYLDAYTHGDENTLDNIGRITTIKKANNVIINTTSFTPANLPKTITYSTGENLNFDYDDNGNMKSAAGPLGTSYLVYDSINHVKQYTDPFNNVINYHIDAAGNLTWIQYQSGKALNISSNGLNQITNVNDWLGGNYQYTYDQMGRLTQVTFPNRMFCVYGYDNNGMVASKTWKKQNGTVLYADTVTRAVWGDVQKIACGNCYPKIKQTKSYGATYDNADQIIQDSLGKHYFDLSGNDTLIKSDSSTIRMGYTANNILASLSSGNSQISYGYDAFFNRIKRTENGKEKRYVINAGLGLTNVLMEQNSSGITDAYNIYGDGLLARIDSGKIVYYITDVKHNVVALADDTAGITDRYIYTLHGKIWKHTGTSKQPYTWLGEYGVQRENDSVYYVRARYYDATRGRFFNRDPYNYDINNPQSINRYVYSLNNAVNMFDWSGLCGDNNDGSLVLKFADKIGVLGNIIKSSQEYLKTISNSALKNILIDNNMYSYSLFKDLKALEKGSIITELPGYLSKLSYIKPVLNAYNDINNGTWNTHNITDFGFEYLKDRIETETIVTSASLGPEGIPIGIGSVLSIDNLIDKYDVREIIGNAADKIFSINK